jgi:hypothetical protein
MESMSVADLIIWTEDRPDLEKEKWRVCWVSRKALRVEVYSAYTSRVCEKALERLWPERYGQI